MDLIKPITKFFEGRLSSPVWQKLTHLVEFAFRVQVRMRRPQPDDADLRDRFCPSPFQHFELMENGNVAMCCPRWLPWPAGNLNAHDADAVWNSRQAQEVRRSVLDGDFKYCNRDLCPAIASNTLPTRAEARKNPIYRDIIDNRKTVMEGKPKFINLANDRSCNLSCPSCRTKRLNFTSGPAYEMRKKMQDRLTKAFFSEPSDEPFTVNVTGSGDPFASRVFREFLYELDAKDFPNLKVALQTNGTLLNEKMWGKLEKIHSNISTVTVSFDAAREETYNITRRGGSWQHLMHNMRFLSQLRRSGKVRYVRLDYVVQAANFREMPEMVALGKEFAADCVFFSKAVNWGAWTAAEYRNVSVWDADHPDHAEFQSIIAQPIFDEPKVFLGNMSHDRRLALRALTPAQAAE